MNKPMSSSSTALFLVAAVALGACGQATSVVVQPLRVINWVPSGGAVCVDPNTRVLVTFSDDLVAASVTAQSLYLASSDGPIAGAPQYDKLTQTVRLAPPASLDFGRLYTIVLTTALEGAHEGTLPVQLESSFATVQRTGCAPGPECQHPSDCPGTQLCSSIGTCIDACVTDRDCPTGQACTAGACG